MCVYVCVCVSVCLSVLNDNTRCVSAVLSWSVPQLPVFPEQTGPRRVSRRLRKVREQGLLAGQEQVCWTVQSVSVCEAEEVVKNRSVGLCCQSQWMSVFEVEEVVKNRPVSVSAGQYVRWKMWSRTGLSVSVPVSV